MLHSLKGIYLIFFKIVLPFYLCALNYYVDKNVASSGNGQSWATAWKNLSNISWGSIQPGDIIYISGGTDSTIYKENLNVLASGSWKNYIYIMAGKYAPSSSGHDGRVIIDGEHIRANVIEIYDQEWIYVKGLEARHSSDRGIGIYGTARHIVIDSLKNYQHYGHHLTIIGHGWGSSDITGLDSTMLVTDVEVKNCYMYNYTNYTGSGQDDIIISDASQQLNIHDNFLNQKNLQIGTPLGQHKHLDPIQTIDVRGVKIWNNVCIVDSGAWGHAMILGMQTRSGGLDTNIIYNNYIYGAGNNHTFGAPQLYLRWYGYGEYPPTFVLNNTVVTSQGDATPIYHERPARWVSNNILVEMGSNGVSPTVYGGDEAPLWHSGAPYQYADSCLNNLFWSVYRSGVEFGGSGGAGAYFLGSGGSPLGRPSGWTAWTTNYGGTGIDADPLFTNDVTTDIGYVISASSPAINAGINLQAFIESKGLPWTDIEGNPRDSSPDIGAYEYDGLLGFTQEFQPLAYKLEQNYPNPFNPATTIKFALPIDSKVKINIYNSLGQLVETLLDREMQSGYHEIKFDGSGLSSGVYLYWLQAQDYVSVKKMILIK